MDLSSLTPYNYQIFGSGDDPRLGSLIKDATALDTADIVIFGVPTDEGIARNGGRVGAANAPASIRSYLAKLTPFGGPSIPGQISALSIADIGDVTGISLEDIHEKARSITQALIAEGKFVIAIGGGHDITYPLVKGAAVGRDLLLINIDPHLDVRPKKNGLHHSGSSFRLLLEENIIKGYNFTEFGIQQHVVSAAHSDWLLDQGSTIVWYDDVYRTAEKNFSKLLKPSMDAYISFDVDSIRASDAPGVSAPAAVGFTAEQALNFCFMAGSASGVRMMDFVEANPLVDRDDQTSRLVARMIAIVLSGFASR